MNERIALTTTKWLGTMWCAYMFIVMCIMPAVWPTEQENILYLSNCFQLVFLPLLMVGQGLLGRAAEARATQDHAALMEILEDIRSGSVCHVYKKQPPTD